jgi:hypothetical protein
MARTFGGLLFYSAPNLNLPFGQNGIGAGAYALVRNGVGDVSLNNAAGVSTVQIFMDCADLKRPYITFADQPGQGTVVSSNEFQEAFGTAAGGPGNPMNGGATPVKGSQFGTPFIPWGLALVDVFAVYSVQTAALTAATLGVTRAIYTENVAFTNNTVLAPTAVALTTTTSATTPHVQKITLPQPLLFEADDFSNLSLEFTITTAGTSAVRVYGMGMHVAVEYGG